MWNSKVCRARHGRDACVRKPADGCRQRMRWVATRIAAPFLPGRLN